VAKKDPTFWYSDDDLAWANGFRSVSEVRTQMEIERNVWGPFGVKNPPRTTDEWKAFRRLQVLAHRLGVLNLEKRARKIGKCSVDHEDSTPGYPATMTVRCEEPDGVEVEVFGLSDASERAALAMISESCDCGASWHEVDPDLDTRSPRLPR